MTYIAKYKCHAEVLRIVVYLLSEPPINTKTNEQHEIKHLRLTYLNLQPWNED